MRIFFPPPLLPLSQVSEEGVLFCGLLVWGFLLLLFLFFRLERQHRNFTLLYPIGVFQIK